MNLDSISESLLREACEDHIGLWKFIWQFREVKGEKDPIQRRQKSMYLVRDLLEEGLLYAGDVKGNWKPIPWNSSLEDTVVRIESGWDALGHEPNIGEIVHFSATHKGISLIKEMYPYFEPPAIR